MVESILNRIEKLKSGILDTDENLSEMVFIYTHAFGITVEEMKKESIPSVMTNLEYLREIHENKKK